MNRPIRTALAAALLAASATAPATAAETFRGRGNEPFWSVEVGAAGIVFTPMEGSPVTVAPVPAGRQDGNAMIYEASADGAPFVLTVADAVCTDTMSGMPFPKTVTVRLGEDAYSGCGGEPAALLVGDWMIAAIDGKPPVSGSTPNLSFDAEGKLAGGGSCNRFFGGYTLSGEGLAISEMGSSMMACDEPLMAQEQAILGILEGVTRFEIGADGALILHDGGGRTLSARPVA
jgi:heat shock protein HslJ